jgi:cell shape-determining protein MreC
MEEGTLKELKIILMVIAVIVGSWAAVSAIRLTIAYYAMENLKQATDQAIKNMNERAQESNERMRQETQLRLKKETEAKRRQELKLQKAAIDKEKSDKEFSNECKFWKLQNKNKPTEKTERKIKEYC